MGGLVNELVGRLVGGLKFGAVGGVGGRWGWEVD